MAVDFSCVVPTFRRPVELLEAVQSALAQEGVSVEVIVVDDSPEQSARSVVARLADPRVRYLAMETPTGGVPGAVRNRGWPLATGAFVHFLDDDDLVPAGHYRTARAEFAAHPDVGVLFGRVQPFGDDDAKLRHESEYFREAARRARSCEAIGKLAFAARQFFEPTMLVCSASLIRRECVEALGGFDEEIRLVEDVEFYARAFRQFGAHFCDRVVLHYRIGPSLMHSRAGDEPIVKSYARAHQKYKDQYGAFDFLALKALSRVGLRLT